MALKVTRPSFDELQKLLQIGRRSGADDRSQSYCLSMYLKTPDGLRLEFTVDAPEADKIAAMRRADAHSELARWLAGDRRTEQRRHDRTGSRSLPATSTLARTSRPA